MAGAATVVEPAHLGVGGLHGGREVGHRVELAGAVVLEERLGVAPDLEREPRDGGRAAQRLRVGRVGLQRDLAPALEPGHPERPRPDERQVGVLRQAVGVHLAPDVLRQDGDGDGQHVGLGAPGGDHHGDVVRRLHVLHAREVLDVGGLPRLQHEVVGEDDVPRGERHPVLPLHALAQVEGPREAVLGGLPARGDVRRRLVVGVVPGEEVVAEAEALPRDGAPGAEGIDPVAVLRRADAVGERGLRRWTGGRRRSGRRGRGGRERRREAEDGRDQQRQRGRGRRGRGLRGAPADARRPCIVTCRLPVVSHRPNAGRPGRRRRLTAPPPRPALSATVR